MRKYQIPKFYNIIYLMLYNNILLNFIFCALFKAKNRYKHNQTIKGVMVHNIFFSLLIIILLF